MPPQTPPVAGTFADLGLVPLLVGNVTRAGLTNPTPIQLQAIPLGLAGGDVLGLAQTGTGKTLAFGLPLIQQLMTFPMRPSAKTARALILAPTRELVNQIADSLRAVAAGSKLGIAVVVGGQSIHRQIAMLAKGTDILVATPGRLIDLMDRRAVDLGAVLHLVLDEADQMLDLGFIHALRKIAPKLGTPRQTMLFSATMPNQLEELGKAYLRNPTRVQVAPPGKAADKTNQSVHFVEKSEKPARLRQILATDPKALTLVFSRTKHGAEKLMKGLVADGFNAASIHGNKSQSQRDRAIAAFREGSVTTLVATDVAARGIDIPGVALVVNYDLPDVPDNYVHRIGRTARAGREGQAIAFCTPEDIGLLIQIETLMKTEVPTGAGKRPGPQKPAGQGARSKDGARKPAAARPTKTRHTQPEPGLTAPAQRRRRAGRRKQGSGGAEAVAAGAQPAPGGQAAPLRRSPTQGAAKPTSPRR